MWCCEALNYSFKGPIVASQTPRYSSLIHHYNCHPPAGVGVVVGTAVTANKTSYFKYCSV